MQTSWSGQPLPGVRSPGWCFCLWRLPLQLCSWGCCFLSYIPGAWVLDQPEVERPLGCIRAMSFLTL